MLKPTYAFFFANLAYLLTGKLRTPNGNTPTSHHHIPDDFACIGVASSNNPQTDGYIIAQLNALGIRRVRLDFTYGDLNKHAGRFLNTLLAEKFIVHLHLVQPFNEAKNMVNQNAQSTWHHFVSETCQTFGQGVALIEIGSTINRKRWAGYDIQGFLTMWDIAYQEIKRHDILLAGPSVTDFEPLYNIGFLSILKSRQQLPDIHTNNLFSERCTEPERPDHKIFGHRLAKVANIRLLKKAFMLQRIGAHFGVPRLHSPSAFWTLPRIARVLPDAPQKQADYLSRYMILSAASGALESAGWGPLICHREGLIDDGIIQYPALERITHYQSVSEQVNDYRLRPAFYAYQAFNQFIAGSEYISQLPTSDGLEIHAFSTKIGFMHAAWTINGKVARMRDVYTSTDMKSAKAYDRDGNQIAVPSLISESPIYMIFDKKTHIALLADAGVTPALSIHAHASNTQHFDYHANNWQGVIAAKDLQEYDLLANALDPSRLKGPSKASILRKARNAIWTIPDPRDSSKKLVVKQPARVPFYKKITDRYKPSKGLRSWTGASELLRRGIDNAKPIAYFEHLSDQTRTQNYYICEYVPANFSARQLFESYANGASAFEGIDQQDAYVQVADYLFDMHSRGVFFRDLSGGNILITKAEQNRLKFSLIDTGRAHFFNHATPLSKRFSDMARACNKLSTEGRNKLMGLYMEKMGKQFGFREKVPFVIYNAKVMVKRKTKLKNILKALGIKKKT